MNKVIFSLTLVFFLAVGSFSNSYAHAPLENNKELACKEKGKKKKKKCCASKEEANKSCNKKESDRKSCDKKQ